MIRPPEHQHTNACMTQAVTNALENFRDSLNGTAFHIALQRGELITEAYGYLHTGTVTCLCTDCSLSCCDNVGQRYTHDCDICIPLGTWDDSTRHYDLYAHPDARDALTTVIARHGEDGEYLSGLSFVGKVPALTEAYARAIQRCLLEGKV